MRAYCKIYLITRKRHAFGIDFFVIRATKARQCLAIHLTLSSEWKDWLECHTTKVEIFQRLFDVCYALKRQSTYSTDYYLTDLCAVDIRTHATCPWVRPPAIRPLRLFSMNMCMPKISPHRMTTKAITRIFVIFLLWRCGLSFMTLSRCNNRK